MAEQVLLRPCRLHRAWGDVRRCRQARTLGRGGTEGLGRQVPFHAAMGVYFHLRHSVLSLLIPFQPFPANIMAGFYAVADSTESVRTDLDNELEGESLIIPC